MMNVGSRIAAMGFAAMWMVVVIHHSLIAGGSAYSFVAPSAFFAVSLVVHRIFPRVYGILSGGR